MLCSPHLHTLSAFSSYGSRILYIRILHSRNAYLFLLSKRDKVLSDLDNTITYVSKQYKAQEKEKGKQRKRNAKHIYFLSSTYAYALQQVIAFS